MIGLFLCPNIKSYLVIRFFSLEPSVREAWEFLLAEMLKSMQKTENLHDSLDYLKINVYFCAYKYKQNII